MTTISGLPEEQHDFGMANGHSPVADKVVCVDFDGTLVPWGPLMAEKDATPGAREAILALKAKGYRIVVFTSRLSWRWLTSAFGSGNWKFYFEQRGYVTDQLERAGIPFDEITAEKIPAEFYIDDKAIRFDGDWRDVVKVIP